MKKSKTTILFTVSITLMILSIGFCVFLFTAIVNKNIHASTIQNALDEKNKQKQNGSILIKNIKEAVSDNKMIDSYLLNPDSIDGFVSHLEKDLNSLGNKTTISSVEFSKGNNKVINIGLIVDGSFNSVFKALKMIEYLPYVVNVKSFNLSAS